MTTHNKSFIASICLLLFLDANHLQESINKIKDFKKSKRRTLLLQWMMMPKHLLAKFRLPSATCFFRGEQQQKEMQVKAESLRVVPFNN